MGSLPPSRPARARAQCEPGVAEFFECRTCAVQYVVSDPETGACAIIDPVLEYDEKSGSTATGRRPPAVRLGGELRRGLDPRHPPPRRSSVCGRIPSREDGCTDWDR